MTDPQGPAERSGGALRDPPPGATVLARRLVQREAKGGPAGDLLGAGERVLQRLHEELARVLGADGYAALEGRAFELARRRYAFLGSGSSGGTPTGPLDQALEALRGRHPREAGDAMQTVCSQLIGLLFTFLGEPLTTHLIRLAWPDLAGEKPEDGDGETR
ncbi:MAG TPA: hypothetical protein VF832_00890 [Longimicrobiales bacterium]